MHACILALIALLGESGYACACEWKSKESVRSGSDEKDGASL